MVFYFVESFYISEIISIPCLFNYNTYMEYFALSDIGKIRASNEDFFYAENNLFIVADGMGGHNAGEIASKSAVNYFIKHFTKLVSEQHRKTRENSEERKINNFSKIISKKSTEDEIQSALISSVKYANDKIFRMGLDNEEYSGMGTTFTCLFIKNEKCYVVHVGDSRLYLFRDFRLKLLTEDHTFVFALYKKGAITYEELFSHPQRNYLTSVIGENELSALESFTFDLLKEDIICICSDGMSSMLDDSAIEQILQKSKSKTAKKITDILIKKTLKNGGNDNITVIVLKN